MQAERGEVKINTGSCRVSRLPGRHGAGHVPHRPGRRPNCGGGGHVLHHLLRLHRGTAREHPPPQDGKKAPRPGR